MSDGTVDPSVPISSAAPPTSATRPPASRQQPPASSPRQGPPAPGSAPRSPQTGGWLQTHPIWTAVGAAALIVALLGIGIGLGRLGASQDLQQSTISVISTVDPSIVQVQGSGVGPGGSIGSGEILTSSGYIVTNSHVVHGMSSYKVLLSNGQTVPAQLVGDVPSQDLAVLKVSASDLKPIAVGDSSQVPVGEFVVAMGSPLGLEQSATSGIVSALNREGREQVDGNIYTLTGMIQTSAPINPGNSGGALVNMRGQLIGIPTLTAVDPSTNVAANGIGFAIASNQMEQVVARFVPSGG